MRFFSPLMDCHLTCPLPISEPAAGAVPAVVDGLNIAWAQRPIDFEDLGPWKAVVQGLQYIRTVRTRDNGFFMKRNITAALLAALTALVVNAAAQDAFTRELASGMADITNTAPAAAPVPYEAAQPAADSAPAGEREWLVLVFVNGRNNLSQAAVADINEMELVGSTDKVAVTVELGLVDDRGTSRRFYISKDTTAGATDPWGEIVSAAVKVPGADMGSWKHFADFAKWSYRKYPAKKVLAILWSHGSGRIDIGGADNAGSELGIAYDDLTRNFIRNKQLAMALKEIGAAIGKKVAVYASDACLMQMASVAYEMKDDAEVIVGSEENVPGAGFPYDSILADLTADPGMGSEALGAVIVKNFAAYYSGTMEDTTLSAIRASALPEFTRLLNDWVRAAAAPAGRAGVLRAGEDSLAFEYGYNGNDTSYNARSKDLHDLVDLAGQNADDGSVLPAKAGALKRFISDKLVIANGTTRTGGDYDRAKGIAVYFPKLIYDPSYDENLFSRDSLWDDFLKWKLDPAYKIK